MIHDREVQLTETPPMVTSSPETFFFFGTTGGGPLLCPAEEAAPKAPCKAFILSFNPPPLAIDSAASEADIPLWTELLSLSSPPAAAVVVVVGPDEGDAPESDVMEGAGGGIGLRTMGGGLGLGPDGKGGAEDEDCLLKAAIRSFRDEDLAATGGGGDLGADGEPSVDDREGMGLRSLPVLTMGTGWGGSEDVGAFDSDGGGIDMGSTLAVGGGIVA